ncbi:MAG: hypothetical protein Q4D92_06435, partial [Slackia sp.]|nr:hypothetical protein [Slackia sp.]
VLIRSQSLYPAEVTAHLKELGYNTSDGPTCQIPFFHFFSFFILDIPNEECLSRRFGDGIQ